MVAAKLHICFMVCFPAVLPGIALHCRYQGSTWCTFFIAIEICDAGAHDSAKLDSLLELFIKKYVQCHQCGNPETRIKIRKDMIHLMCKVRTHVRVAIVWEGRGSIAEDVPLMMSGRIADDPSACTRDASWSAKFASLLIGPFTHGGHCP